MNQKTHCWRPIPLWRAPKYAHRLRDAATRADGLAPAVAAMFTEARIGVHVVGDTTRWARPGHGVLLVSDHTSGYEFVPLLAVAGALGRPEAHFVANPFSRNARIMDFMSPAPDEIVIPVVPGTLAQDVPLRVRHLFGRLVLGDRAPTLDELRKRNGGSVHRAAELLDAGRMVTIYPHGAVADACRTPWRRGLGQIIKAVAPERRPTAEVALIRFDPFAATRIRRRLMLLSRGVTPLRPYRITLRIGPRSSIADLFGSETVIDHLTAQEITELLRRRYLTTFGKGPVQLG